VALVALALLLLMGQGRPLSVHAQPDLTFIVDSSADAPDALPGDGLCVSTASGCTLRAAIQEANASNGADTIVFAPAVVGTSVTLTNHLDPVIERVTIDASNCWPLFQVCGGGFGINANGHGGLVLDESLKSGPGQGSTIRGLEIYNAAGSWSGATPSGPGGATRSVNASACTSTGICILSNGNHTIGGDAGSGAAPAGQGNVIRDNDGDGIRIDNSAGGDHILGNRIGLSADGLHLGGNGAAGIAVTGSSFSSDIFIGDFGGTGAQGDRNLIAGNGTGESAPGGIRAIATNANLSIVNNWLGANISGAGFEVVGLTPTLFANYGHAIEGSTYNAMSLIGNKIGGGFMLGNSPTAKTTDGIHLTGSTGITTILGNCIGFLPDCVSGGPFKEDDIDLRLQGGVTIIGDGTIPGRNYLGNTAESTLTGVYASHARVQVVDNFIGVAVDGMTPAPIIGSCIYIDAVDGNTVNSNLIANCGGLEATAAVASVLLNQSSGSSVSFNDITSPSGADAIVVQGTQAAGNLLRSNTVRMVGTALRPNALPIDLRLDTINQEGPTANDTGDGDGGPNGLHNYPVMPTSSGADNCATGTAAPGDIVEVFAVSGGTYTPVATGTAGGNGSFSICGVGGGMAVVATATATAAGPDPADSTSEMTPTVQTVGGSASSVFGNLNCGPGVDVADAIQVLLYLAALGVDNPGSCPDVGALVVINGTQMLWGDIDCNGVIDVSDAIRLLLWLAGLAAPTPPGCPAIGATISIG